MSNAGGDHVVELVPATNHDEGHSPIAPLLTQDHNKPNINIFTLSYSRRGRSKDEITRVVESSSEVSVICRAISSTIYSFMEVISYALPVSSIPLFESILTRCTMILSFLWLRRTGQPIFEPSHCTNSTYVPGCCIELHDSYNGFNCSNNNFAGETEGRGYWRSALQFCWRTFHIAANACYMRRIS